MSGTGSRTSSPRSADSTGSADTSQHLAIEEPHIAQTTVEVNDALSYKPAPEFGTRGNIRTYAYAPFVCHWAGCEIEFAAESALWDHFVDRHEQVLTDEELGFIGFHLVEGAAMRAMDNEANQFECPVCFHQWPEFEDAMEHLIELTDPGAVRAHKSYVCRRDRWEELDAQRGACERHSVNNGDPPANGSMGTLSEDAGPLDLDKMTEVEAEVFFDLVALAGVDDETRLEWI